MKKAEKKYLKIFDQSFPNNFITELWGRQTMSDFIHKTQYKGLSFMFHWN